MKFLSISTFFVDVNKLILKFIWKGTDSKIAYKKKKKKEKRKLQERKKWEELLYLIYEKPLYGSEIQIVWSWQRDRHTERRWNTKRT